MAEMSNKEKALDMHNRWFSDEAISNYFKKRWIDIENEINSTDVWPTNEDTINDVERVNTSYKEDDWDANKKLLNSIKWNSEMSAQEKTNALKKLAETSKSSAEKRNSNLPDDLTELSAISEKNKNDANISKDATSSIYNEIWRYAYKWMTPNKSDKLLNEIKQIYSDWNLDDKTKKKKIQYIVTKAWWDDWNAYIERAYEKYINTKDDNLSEDELAEKKMLMQYKINFNRFKAKANTYLNALNADVSEWAQTRYNFTTDLWF